MGSHRTGQPETESHHRTGDSDRHAVSYTHLDLYPNTDWQDAVLTGSGLSHSHTVSLGIGSERVRMLTTLGYVDQNGIIETTDFQRYTFRNNADVKFNDKLSMKLDLSFSNGDRRSSPYQGTIFNLSLIPI